METEKLRKISFLFGLGMLVFFIYNRIYPINFDYYELDIVFFIFYSILVRITSVLISNQLSKSLNRNNTIWILLSLFFPMYPLLILPFLNSKEDENNEKKLLSSAKELITKDAFEEAIEKYNQIIKTNPSNVKALTGRAQVKELIGLYNEAILDYDKAIEIKLIDANLYFERAKIKLIIDDIEGAEIDLNKAGELGKDKANELLNECNLKRNFPDRNTEIKSYDDSASEISIEEYSTDLRNERSLDHKIDTETNTKNDKNESDMIDKKKQIPLTTDGKPDFKLMSSEMLANEIFKIFGENSVNELQDSIDNFEKDKSDLLSKKMKDLNEKAKRIEVIKEIDLEIQRLQNTINILNNSTSNNDFKKNEAKINHEDKKVTKSDFNLLSNFKLNPLNLKKKVLIGLGMFLLLMILLNPSNERFTDYIRSRGFNTKQSRYEFENPSWGRKNNYLFFSIYIYNSSSDKKSRNSGSKYLGIFNNFIYLE
jgi:tetratricopeptide (TPR) repeat protein